MTWKKRWAIIGALAVAQMGLITIYQNYIRANPAAPPRPVAANLYRAAGDTVKPAEFSRAAQPLPEPSFFPLAQQTATVPHEVLPAEQADAFEPPLGKMTPVAAASPVQPPLPPMPDALPHQIQQRAEVPLAPTPPPPPDLLPRGEPTQWTWDGPAPTPTPSPDLLPPAPIPTASVPPVSMEWKPPQPAQVVEPPAPHWNPPPVPNRNWVNEVTQVVEPPAPITPVKAETQPTPVPDSPAPPVVTPTPPPVVSPSPPVEPQEKPVRPPQPLAPQPPTPPLAKQPTVVEGVPSMVSKAKAEKPVGTCPWALRVEIIDGRTMLTAAHGKEIQFQINCEKLNLETPRGTIEALGNVKLYSDGLDGQCDRLTIAWIEDHVILEGKAEVKCYREGQQVELKSTRLSLRLATAVNPGEPQRTTLTPAKGN